MTQRPDSTARSSDADTTASGWRHVPSPSEAEPRDGGATSEGEPGAGDGPGGTTPTHVPGSRRVRRRPARASEPLPSRGRGLLVGLVVSAMVVVLAAAGGYLASRLTPENVSTQTQTATRPPFELTLPLQIGEYSRDANEGNTPTRAADGKTTLSATYSKGGQPAFVLLLARPYPDGKQFMLDLNMNAVTPVEDGLCGVSGDNANNGCSVIRDNTGILVLSTVDVSRAELMDLTHQISRQVAGS